MVDDVVDIIRVEILQDRYNDGSISDGSHIGDAPTCIVLADDSYFVASSQAAMFEQQMQACDLFGHLSVSVADIFTVIGVTRQIPVFAKAILV